MKVRIWIASRKIGVEVTRAGIFKAPPARYKEEVLIKVK